MHIPTTFAFLFLFPLFTIAELVTVQVDRTMLKPLKDWSFKEPPVLSSVLPLVLPQFCGWSTSTTGAHATFTFKGSSLSVYGAATLVLAHQPFFEAMLNGQRLQNPADLSVSVGCNQLLFQRSGLDPEIESTFVLNYIGSPLAPSHGPIVALQFITYDSYVSENGTTLSSSQTTTSTISSSQAAPNSSSSSTKNTSTPSGELTTPTTSSVASSPSSPVGGSSSNPSSPSPIPTSLSISSPTNYPITGSDLSPSDPAPPSTSPSIAPLSSSPENGGTASATQVPAPTTTRATGGSLPSTGPLSSSETAPNTDANPGPWSPTSASSATQAAPSSISSSQSSIGSSGSPAHVSIPLPTNASVFGGFVGNLTASSAYSSIVAASTLTTDATSVGGTSQTFSAAAALSSGVSSSSTPSTRSSSVATSSSRGMLSVSMTNTALPSGGVSRGEDPPATSHSHRTSVIAGSTVGAVLGAVLLASAAATRREWLKYVWSSLAFALGFGFYYSARRFIFVGDKDLPETRIALFISPTQPVDEKEDEKLVWNACTVGTAQNKNEVFFDLPCNTNGQPRLFFGRYQRRNDHISCTEYAEAPAVLEQSQGSTEPHLIRQTHEDTRNQLISAVNRSTAPMTLALGTGRKISTQGDMGILPFMTIPESHFGAGTTYQLEGDLYLHAFKVKNECQGGRFYPQAVGAESILQDRITEPRGIKLDELKGLTTILVKQGKDGRLALKIVKNKKKDLKKYQHECKIDQSALRQEYREIEPSVGSSV